MEEKSFIRGVGIGALFMYLFDPDRGVRRRSLIRDQVIHLGHEWSDLFETGTRDINNRIRGTLAEFRSMFTSEDVPDQVIEARVRSNMGHVTSHPGAIDVTVFNGHVRLSGPVLQDEVDDILQKVSSVRGVKSVENNLKTHESPANISSFQGGGRRRTRGTALAEEDWPPSTRLLASTAGSLLLLYGIGRRDLFGIIIGGLGFGLASRSTTNMELKRITGIGAGRRAIDIQKTITIDAPVERVFEFWDNFENFPRFMSSVLEVRDLGNGQSHWKVAGPLGSEVSWQAEITRRIPNKILAWRTVSSATVDNAGIIRFDSEGDGRTRVDIKLSYNPPAGAIGHGFASLFGSDPKTEMDEDLARMKTLIETGKPPRDASKPIKLEETQSESR